MIGKSKPSKATAIPKEVAEEVLNRDGHKCIICGRYDVQLAHYISRARLGLGAPENLVCLCPECHYKFDNGKYHKEIKKAVEEYLNGKYDDWENIPKVYSKY